ncbi:ATP-binding protein [uncultured Altibacter sp.]|uniref:ATP-binding protein n=1 Tax=Altibacter sp. TaxID=2024823 RepID=UPI0030DD3459
MLHVVSQEPHSNDTTRVFTLDDTYPIQSLFSKTDYFIASEKNYSIDGILRTSHSNLFQPLKDSIIISEYPIWLRVSIQPRLTLTNQHLVFKSIYENFNYVTPHDSIKAYYVQNQVVRDSLISGVYVAASKKAVPFPASLLRFPISLVQDEATTVYFKIYDKTKIYTQIELRDPAIAFNQKEQPVWISGFAIILSIYVLAFFFYTRDRSYLYLFGYFAFVGIYEQSVILGLPFLETLFSEFPKASIIAWIFLTMGSKAIYLQFGRKFTNLKQINALWDKIVVGVICYFLIVIPTSVVILSIGINPLVSVQYVFAGIGFLLVLLITIRLAFYKDTMLRYFVASSIWSFIFSILGILWQNGLIPFWETPNPWMIANMGLMFILALAIARKMQLSERAKSEVAKVREIASIKSKFFANISHEFRTPLSLILGPINQSLENIPASEAIEDSHEIPVRGKHLKVMKRNAIRLQNLVDQILDLSKLDQGRMSLQVSKGDLIQFVKSIVFSFESLTEIKHIQFQTHFPKTIENSYYDRDKLEKILVNLLSNAIKFTPEHGRVTVTVEDRNGLIKIKISNTGSGIPKEAISHIFDRFYQTETTQDQGTGIGLALVKELVGLHGGHISVTSTEGIETVFKVILPYRKAHFSAEAIIDVSTESALNFADSTQIALEATSFSVEHNFDTKSPLLLIVEDNPDLRAYIAEQLETTFNILAATNGKEGMSIALTKLPDLIISDVMMPEMNGIELCEVLKTDIRTSHIPIILLTAKAGQKAKIEGLETGADDYLIKPFDGRELLIRAKNLIDQRAQLREKFGGELKVGPSEIRLSSMDERFIKEVIKTIEEHMDNEFYSVEDLACSVGFSKSQLNRKLKSIVGKSPNQMIREFRLTRAKDLLEQKAASVSEVAYQVGYANLSYFSKSYKEAFGVLPSDV